jgi:hypothetical protein
MPGTPRANSAAPTPAALAKTLGKAKPHWDALQAAAAEAAPNAGAEWKYYASLKGWRCIVKAGRLSLAHLRPDEGSFLASFGLSDKAIDAAAAHGVPAELIEAARAAKKGTEGRPLRVQVKTAKDLRAVVGLLKAKARG